MINIFSLTVFIRVTQTGQKTYKLLEFSYLNLNCRGIMLIHVILFIKRHPGSWDMLFSGAVRLTDVFLDKILRCIEEEKTTFGFTGDDTTHG